MIFTDRPCIGLRLYIVTLERNSEITVFLNVYAMKVKKHIDSISGAAS
jgi:hypothetical protein